MRTDDRYGDPPYREDADPFWDEATVSWQIVPAIQSPGQDRVKKRSDGRWPKWLADRLPTERSRRIFLVSIILGAVVIVLLPAVSALMTARQIESLALDGVHHLESVKAKVPSSSDLTTVLDGDTLASMQSDLNAANKDFTQMNAELNSSPIIGIAGVTSGIGGEIETVRHLGVIGVDVTKLGNLVVQSGIIAANYIHASPLSATKPIITQANLDTIQNDLAQAGPLIDDIAAQSQGVSFSSLPVSSSSLKLLTKFLADLPQVRQELASAQQFAQLAPSLLGIGKPITFLLVTMDRSELRATGGFQGNFAVVTMQDGHLSGGIHLDDTYNIDEKNGVCWNSGSVAPAAYSSWWPYHCMGVRDSSLSADFPTTAKYAISLYKDETGQQVSGMIAMTPVLIEQILKLTGPIKFGSPYNVTVTSQNLESVIHEYQLTDLSEAGNELPPSEQVSSVRKRFTALLGQSLQDRLHGLSSSLLGSVAKYAIEDIKTKDIQLYFTDSKAEQFLSEQQLDGSLYRGSGDGLFAVDTNLSGKQNTYMHETYTDQVHLDSKGGATHHLTISYHFDDPTLAPTYSIFCETPTACPGDHYRDYLRVYIPANSQQMGGNPYVVRATSDEHNRAMFAGWISVDLNTTVSLTFTWYVPNAVPKGGDYSYIVQRQAGMQNNALRVTIYGPASATKPIATYATPKNASMEEDVTITAP